MARSNTQEDEHGMQAVWTAVKAQDLRNQQCFKGIERMLQEIQGVVTGAHVGGDRNQDIENQPKGGHHIAHQ